ncbi:MAG: hypothetical protein OWQ57_10600 [Sulfobacillus sp.]|nr:hypothetical protein [Sulfobacillus sp.]
MPIGPLPPGCIAVCSPPAEDVTNEIPVKSGVCQLFTDGLTLSDVVVTDCVIESVSFTEITPRAVGLTVEFRINFSFTGTIDDFSFHGQGSCQDSLFIVDVILPTHEHFATPLDCAAHLSCTARDVGFDAETGVQTFIVHIQGELTCVGCPEVPYTIVQVCPSMPASTM